MLSVILAGKRDSRRHSSTSFSKNFVAAKTSYRYEMLEVLLFCDRLRGLTCFKKITVLTFLVKKKYDEAFRDVFFLRIRQKNFK